MPDRGVVLSPRRFDVDLSRLDGVTVLGERLAVLFSALLRVQLGRPEDGVVELSVRWPRHEGRALERAMARVERAVPGDRRTRERRDLDLFLAVVERVSEAVDAVHAGRAQHAFRKQA